MGEKTGRSSLFAQEAVSNSMTPAEQPRGVELRDRVIRDRHRSTDGGMVSFGPRVTAEEQDDAKVRNKRSGGHVLLPDSSAYSIEGRGGVAS